MTAGVAQQGYISIKQILILVLGGVADSVHVLPRRVVPTAPGADELTGYYLTIAAGGALGGVFVGLVAPRIFTEYLELPIAVLGSMLWACGCCTIPDQANLRMGAITTAATDSPSCCPKVAPPQLTA